MSEAKHKKSATRWNLNNFFVLQMCNEIVFFCFSTRWNASSCNCCVAININRKKCKPRTLNHDHEAIFCLKKAQKKHKRDFNILDKLWETAMSECKKGESFAIACNETETKTRKKVVKSDHENLFKIII